MELVKFKELYGADIEKFIDKNYKGLKYLSWAVAYKLAMEADPSVKFRFIENEDGIPMFSRGDIHFVKTEVEMFGEKKQMILPVMDNKHNACTNPDARHMNDNLMRCLAKNIALFGIGLSLYTGEDTASYIDSKEPTSPVKKAQVAKPTKAPSAAVADRATMIKTLESSPDVDAILAKAGELSNKPAPKTLTYTTQVVLDKLFEEFIK